MTEYEAIKRVNPHDDPRTPKWCTAHGEIAPSPDKGCGYHPGLPCDVRELYVKAGCGATLSIPIERPGAVSVDWVILKCDLRPPHEDDVHVADYDDADTGVSYTVRWTDDD